ncbi:MAG: WD40 repeat domain-containing protein [Armatimonadota bacterium]
MRRRRIIGLALALGVILGAAWVLRIVLSPPRQVHVLADSRSVIWFNIFDVEDGLRFSPDGRYLITTGVPRTRGGYKAAVIIWRVNDWNQVHVIPGAIRFWGFTSAGRMLLSHRNWKARLWNVHSGTVEPHAGIPPRRGLAARVSPDERWIAGKNAEAQDGVMFIRSLRDPDSGETQVNNVREIRGFSPDSRYLLYTPASRGRNSRVQDGKGGWLRLPPLNPAIRGWTCVAEAGTGRQLQALPANLAVFTPSSDLLAGVRSSVLGGGAHVTSGNGVVTFWNTRSWQIEKKLQTGSAAICGLAFSGDGKMLAVASENQVQVFDLDSGLELLSQRVNEGRPDVALAPGGNLLAVSIGRGQIGIWYLPPREQLVLRTKLQRWLRR